MDEQRIRDDLHRQLIKLADIIETTEYGKERNYYNREYKRVAKALYPEAYKTVKQKFPKPSQSIIKTLKPCDCGQQGWTFERLPPDGVRISCSKCERKSEIVKSNTLARDSWNSTFEIKLF